MQERTPIFASAQGTDALLAREVADRAGLSLAPEWVSGVALNARLMQRHLDTMRGIDGSRR